MNLTIIDDYIADKKGDAPFVWPIKRSGGLQRVIGEDKI